MKISTKPPSWSSLANAYYTELQRTAQEMKKELADLLSISIGTTALTAAVEIISSSAAVVPLFFMFFSMFHVLTMPSGIETHNETLAQKLLFEIPLSLYLPLIATPLLGLVTVLTIAGETTIQILAITSVICVFGFLVTLATSLISATAITVISNWSSDRSHTTKNKSDMECEKTRNDSEVAEYETILEAYNR